MSEKRSNTVLIPKGIVYSPKTVLLLNYWDKGWIQKLTVNWFINVLVSVDFIWKNSLKTVSFILSALEIQGNLPQVVKNKLT